MPSTIPTPLVLASPVLWWVRPCRSRWWKDCAQAAYGATVAGESYYCNFGLNAAYESALEASGLCITGRDSDGEARVVELPARPFFVATLFVPRANSRPEKPHPLSVRSCAAAIGGMP